MQDAVLALEFGGTRLRGGLVAEDGALLASASTATEAHLGVVHVLQQADTVLAALGLPAERWPMRGIGISAAGVIDAASARVIAANDTMPGWAGTDLRSHFGTRLGAALPVCADNDANCALAGELWRGGHGRADGRALHVMLTLGTGLGGAIAYGDEVMAGASQRAGHFGSMRVWHARQQTLVPLESVVSGTGLMHLYHLMAPAGAPRASGGLQVTQWAADACAPAHAHARDALQEWVDLLAAFLRDLYWSLDPGLVIIGGGVLRSQALWWGALQRSLADQRVPMPLAPATLGDDAGLLGAARLAWQQLPR